MKVRFAVDSPLEGDGFELPVPGREAVKPSCETLSKTGADLLGNRRFESCSLQQRVRCELDFLTDLNGSAGRPTEMLSQVGAMLAGPAALCRPRRERSPAHPRGKPGFLTHEDKVAREAVPRLR